jgi:hypothetical protein
MKFSTLCLIILVLLITGTANAQFVGPPSFTPDVLDNPIDGGLGLLLGAGAAYGAKKIRDARMKKNQGKEDES